MSSEYVLWDDNEVVREGAVKRLHRNLRWPQEAYDTVKQDAHSQYSAKGPDRIEYELPVPLQAPEPGQRKPYTIQIRLEDWLEHGVTP